MYTRVDAVVRIGIADVGDDSLHVLKDVIVDVPDAVSSSGDSFLPGRA